MTRRAWDHGGKTRQQRGYGAEHDRIRAELMATVVLCEECTRHGRVRVGTIADHVIPLAKGGSGDRSNYQLLCGTCAEAKDAADRGVRLKRRPTIDVSGWPIDDGRGDR